MRGAGGGRRWLGRGLGGLVLVLGVLGVAVPWAGPRVAEEVLEGALRGAGLSGAAVRVERVGPWGAELGGLSGERAWLRVEEAGPVRAVYAPGVLLGERLKAVLVEDFRLSVAVVPAVLEWLGRRPAPEPGMPRLPVEELVAGEGEVTLRVGGRARGVRVSARASQELAGGPLTFGGRARGGDGSAMQAEGALTGPESLRWKGAAELADLGGWAAFLEISGMGVPELPVDVSGGTASVQARGGSEPGAAPAWSGKLRVDGLGVAMRGGPLAAGGVSVEALGRGREVAGRVEAARVELGAGEALTELAVPFQGRVTAEGGLRVRGQAQARWRGGTVGCAFTVARGGLLAGEWQADLELTWEDVPAGPLAGLFGGFGGEVAGRLRGRQPVKVRGERLIFGEGEVTLMPGTGGRVRLEEETVSALAAGRGLGEEAQRALRDVRLSAFTGRLFVREEGGGRLWRLQIEGSSEVPRVGEVPVRLTVDVRGPAQELGELLLRRGYELGVGGGER